MRQGRDQGGTQVNSISECKNLRVENSVKSSGFPQWLFWLLVSSVVKAAEVTGKWIALAAWLVLVVSDFLPFFSATSVHLSFACLWVR